MKNRPRVLDLFCGIGGLTLGLHRAGFDSIGGIDIWDEALATFDRNLSPIPSYKADIQSVRIEDIESELGVTRAQIDVMAGGPPCQGFSTVGKRQSGDPRNQLWISFFELVREIRPAYVLIENVEGMVVMDKGDVCRNIVDSFGELGFEMEYKLIRAADFGVPQLRKRVFFLGWLGGLEPVCFPQPTISQHISVAEAIFDLPALSAGETACRYSGKPNSEYQKARRGAQTELYNHEAANHPHHLVEILKYVPDGGNRKSIPDAMQPKSGFHNSYARLASWKPAIAVTSNMRKPSSARATHPTQHRGLTVREGLRLQSFNDDFVAVGSRTSQYLQVGNAVPPLLAEAVGKSLMAAYQKNSAEKLLAARGRKPSRTVRRKGTQAELAV